MFVTEFDGVFFIEGGIPEPCNVLGQVSFEGSQYHSQQQSLRDVKRNLALQAKQLGANAVVNFSYGQKETGFWRTTLFSDQVQWYGTGVAAKIDTRLIEE